MMVEFTQTRMAKNLTNKLTRIINSYQGNISMVMMDVVNGEMPLIPINITDQRSMMERLNNKSNTSMNEHV